MEKAPALGKRAAAELVGTLVFVFIAAGSVVASSYLSMVGFFGVFFVALATGLALSLAVSATMNVSGGHINPAVTVAAFVAKKIKGKEALVYIGSQVAGAVIGAALLLYLFPANVGAAVQWGTPALGQYVGAAQGIVIEAILTFILVFMVFGTVIDRRAPKIGGFGVGLAVMMDALVGGSLTGAAMNPARAIGPAIVSLSFANWYVYWIGPIIGAVVAALVYSRVIME